MTTGATSSNLSAEEQVQALRLVLRAAAEKRGRTSGANNSTQHSRPPQACNAATAPDAIAAVPITPAAEDTVGRREILRRLLAKLTGKSRADVIMNSGLAPQYSGEAEQVIAWAEKMNAEVRQQMLGR